MDKNLIIQGDCLEELKNLPDNSVDSCVTDPPYELGFMGKSWDNSGIAYNVYLWKEVLRVLKPGGHLLSFGGTRTYHRMAVAIEDAGFEVRDMIEYIYGSGFPKSLNIGKAVDKLQGNEREVVGENPNYRPVSGKEGYLGESNFRQTNGMSISTKGTSDWEGWGTALKPAHEPICMARKPLAEKTVAENCLKWGTGGINIDGSRVGTGTGETKIVNYPNIKGDNYSQGKHKYNETVEYEVKDQGRFPANLLHDNSEEVRECFPDTVSKWGKQGDTQPDSMFFGKHKDGIAKESENYIGDSGNASRFFKSIIYTAKASKSERNRGCEGLEEKENAGSYEFRTDGSLDGKTTQAKANFHPTVKPIALMEYLIKMVTPKGGTVLDPFMGSGTTGVACKQNGFNFTGIELEEDYIKIAKKRIDAVPEVLL